MSDQPASPAAPPAPSEAAAASDHAASDGAAPGTPAGPPAPPPLTPRQIKALFWALYLLGSLVILLVGLKIVDLRYQRGPLGDESVYGAMDETPWITSYELYPYTGYHTQAKYHAFGQTQNWWYYKHYDFHTGDHGFSSTDIDFDKPPPKPDHEFRIIMIGGSAAWGEGARTNDDLHFRILEKLLDQALVPKGIDVRVINMGMGGWISYQNYISLNRWGHQLHPDLILSFSGRNELWHPSFERGTDLPHKFENVQGLIEASKHHNSPPWLMTLGRWFPGLIKHSNLGTALRMLDLPRYTEMGFERYKEGRNIEPLSFWLHALASIKRDFLGIPMMVVAQPVFHPQIDVYRQFIGTAFEQIRKNPYLNDKWFLVDMSRMFLENPQVRAEVPKYMVDEVHLSNDGQRLAAEIMAAELEKIIPTLMKESAPKAAPPQPPPAKRK